MKLIDDINNHLADLDRQMADLDRKLIRTDDPSARRELIARLRSVAQEMGVLIHKRAMLEYEARQRAQQIGRDQ